LTAKPDFRAVSNITFVIQGMAAKRNTLGPKDEAAASSGKREKPSGKSEKPSGKAEKRNAGHQPVGTEGAARKFRKFVTDPRTHRIFGASLILLSVYLFIAFSSYLITWKLDHDKVSGQSFFGFLFTSGAEVENWLGRLGAILSHIMIFNWFGLASFGLVFLLFVFGVRIATGVALLPIMRTFKLTGVGILVFSILMGYISTPSNRFIGGSFGYHIADWLRDSTGSIGTLLLIGLMVFTYVVVFFNPSFRFLKSSGADTEDDAQPEDIQPEEDRIRSTNTIRREDIPVEEPPPVFEVELETSEPDPEPEMEMMMPEPEPEPVIEEHDLQMPEDDGEFSVVAAATEENVSDDELNARLAEFGEYDPKLDLSSYTLPTIDFLNAYGNNAISINKEELEENKNRIVDTLSNYGIAIDKIKATVGPTVTLYEIIPAPGVRISKIKNLEDDIALTLAALGIRIIAPIPGKGTIGIEVPNSKPDVVSMKSLIQSDKFQNNDMELPVALGKTIANETFVTDLTKMPHLLMAGATGQGKSVGLNAILVSILYKKHPAQVKFVLVDPKKVELTLFNKIERHFLAKLPGEEKAIITDTSKVVNTLNSLCVEMDDRYALLEEAHVRTIKEYNKKFIERRLNPEKGHRYLPYIVVVVDEFADLIMTAGKEVETPIARLAQLARAIGIHLIIATQRPSVNIITGTIKANFPARIAFRVTSKIDSRTILDTGGADQLIGRGDMLYSTGNDLVRLQCGFVDTPEVESICQFIGDQRGYPDAYLLPEVLEESSGDGADFDDGDMDSLFEDAAQIVVNHQQGSASLLQRKLKIGYNRAGRLIDQLEAAGVIGPFKGSKAREVLFPDVISLEQYLKHRGGNHD
jgi:S-DNA-T family DNA segregation ATPase FtsK/SpoIIIE